MDREGFVPCQIWNDSFREEGLWHQQRGSALQGALCIIGIFLLDD